MTAVVDPQNITPETDAGSETSARFRYQAEVTFPFCLHCALGDEILSVIPEHLEDIAIEYADRWRFIQVKSRNPERGLWRLADILADGGALHSLWRTHGQVRSVNASLELVLEGAVKPGDPIECLLKDGDHRNRTLVTAVSKRLQISKPVTHRFLQQVILVPPPTPRPYIRATNILLLQGQNKSVLHTIVEEIYDSFLVHIERAMRGGQLGPEWPRYVVRPEIAPSDLQEKLNAKRLTKSLLQAQVSPITSPSRPLLKRIAGESGDAISTLEKKLLVGGGTPKIIERARELRANAQHHWFAVRSNNLFPDDARVDDLRQRLETYAETKEALHETSVRPANEIWNSLLSEFTAHPRTIDPDGLMSADPMLLLGELCELSNCCQSSWGVASA